MCSTDSWPADIVRIGVAIEAVGFILALCGLNSTWRFAGGPGIVATVGRLVRAVALGAVRVGAWSWHWIVRVVRRLRGRRALRVEPISAEATVRAAGPEVALASDFAARALGRLDVLEARLRDLSDEVARERDAINRAIAGERIEREAGDEEAHRRLNEFARNGLVMAVAGVLLFFLAAVLTGLPVGADHVVRDVLGLRCR